MPDAIDLNLTAAFYYIVVLLALVTMEGRMMPGLDLPETKTECLGIVESGLWVHELEITN